VKALKGLFTPLMVAALLLSMYSLKGIIERVGANPLDGPPVSIHLALRCEPGDPLGGSTASVSIALRNAGTKPVVVQFPRNARYTVEGFKGDAKVWSASSSATGKSIEAFMLAPGQTRTYVETWVLKDAAGKALEAGTYVIRGVFGGEWPGQRGHTEMAPLMIMVK
jgi:hypothetical protein